MKESLALATSFFLLILVSCRRDREKALNILLHHKDEHEQVIINHIRKVPVDWILSDGIFYKNLKAGDSLVIMGEEGNTNVFRASKTGYCRIVTNDSAKYVHGILYVTGTYCYTDIMY